MHKIYVVDAFADEMFTGNPAAVCLLEHDVNEVWMQNLAAEMKHAETAFVTRDMNLRWFTPTVEVDLCGHATLASAHVLGLEEVTFTTKSGELVCRRSGDLIEMDFPSTPCAECTPPVQLLSALGLEHVKFCGMSPFDHFLEVDSEDTLRGLAPNFAELAKINVRGTIVTTQGTDFDFVSRFFAPASGVDEDPVTGSAHCALTPYWSTKLGKDNMRAYQASPRGGVIQVRQRGDRVDLAGKAITVLSGQLSG